MKPFSHFSGTIASFMASQKRPPRNCRRAAARLIWAERPRNQDPSLTWREHWESVNNSDMFEPKNRSTHELR